MSPCAIVVASSASGARPGGARERVATGPHARVPCRGARRWLSVVLAQDAGDLLAADERRIPPIASTPRPRLSMQEHLRQLEHQWRGVDEQLAQVMEQRIGSAHACPAPGAQPGFVRRSPHCWPARPARRRVVHDPLHPCRDPRQRPHGQRPAEMPVRIGTLIAGSTTSALGSRPSLPVTPGSSGPCRACRSRPVLAPAEEAVGEPDRQVERATRRGHAGRVDEDRVDLLMAAPSRRRLLDTIRWSFSLPASRRSSSPWLTGVSTVDGVYLLPRVVLDAQRFGRDGSASPPRQLFNGRLGVCSCWGPQSRPWSRSRPGPVWRWWRRAEASSATRAPNPPSSMARTTGSPAQRAR